MDADEELLAMAPVRYTAEMPGTEALWLGGGSGPLATEQLPGEITLPEGAAALDVAVLVTLDSRAFVSLRHLGCISGDKDGRVVLEGELPVLVIGNARYVIREL